MNPEVKALWTSALLSGKYKQGRNFLRAIREDGTEEFCCLGVLCDLAVQNGVPLKINIVESYDGTVYRYDGETGVLPDKVINWAGLHSAVGYIRRIKTTNKDGALSDMNDVGEPFASIAQVIEDHF